MQNAVSELVRLSAEELALVDNFRHCNAERQDVLLHLARELRKQTRVDTGPKTGNVVLLTGRKLR